eukprot:Awhi_evm1s8713
MDHMRESFHDFDRNKITLMKLKGLVQTRLSVVHYEKWWDELNKKSKCELYQKIQLDDMANAQSMKKG